MSTFEDYVGCYIGKLEHHNDIRNRNRNKKGNKGREDNENKIDRLYYKLSDNWEITLSLSPGQFQQVNVLNLNYELNMN